MKVRWHEGQKIALDKLIVLVYNLIRLVKANLYR